MRTTFVVLLQLLLAFLVAGALMPIIVLTMSNRQSPWSGPWMAAALVLVLFVTLRLVWPRKRG